MKAITLHGPRAAGRVALVDDEDYARVAAHKWFIHEKARPGRRPSGPYARTFIRREGKRVGIFMHTLLTGQAETDHVNHNGLDNQRVNLRPGRRRNQQNARPWLHRSSEFKGVTWYKQTSRWKAQIRSGPGSRKVHLGFFSSEIAAAQAYDKAALAAFGEYAYLNFPTRAVPETCP